MDRGTLQRWNWMLTYDSQRMGGTYYGTFAGAVQQIADAVQIQGWGFSEAPAKSIDVKIAAHESAQTAA